MHLLREVLLLDAIIRSRGGGLDRREGRMSNCVRKENSSHLKLPPEGTISLVLILLLALLVRIFFA